MQQVTFAIELDEQSAETLADVLTSEADADIQGASKANLDGSAETIIQIVQLALSAAGLVPALIGPFLDRRKVRKIKFGDFEIENPTKEQVDQLWKDYLASRSGAETDS